MTNGDDEARRIILARRARFVAAALAGAGIATASCESSPQPCLKPAPPAGGQYNDADVRSNAGGRQSGAGGAGGAAVTDAAFPLPCLTPQVPRGENGNGEGS